MAPLCLLLPKLRAQKQEPGSPPSSLAQHNGGAALLGQPGPPKGVGGSCGYVPAHTQPWGEDVALGDIREPPELRGDGAGGC